MLLNSLYAIGRNGNDMDKSKWSGQDICFAGVSGILEHCESGSGASRLTKAELKALTDLQFICDRLTDRSLAKVLLMGTLILGKRLEAKEVDNARRG